MSETLAGITHDAARRGQVSRKKVAATAPVLRRLLVGFAGALRRSELAAVQCQHLERTERGIRLTLPRSKGEQTDAVGVPLPYGDTELCPVHALDLWLDTVGIITLRP